MKLEDIIEEKLKRYNGFFRAPYNIDMVAELVAKAIREAGYIHKESAVDIKDFKWLRSIRLCVKNGYMCDEDCHRIQEYFESRSVLDEVEILKFFDEVYFSENSHITVKGARKVIENALAKSKDKVIKEKE